MNIVDTGPLLRFLQADCGRHFFKGLQNNPIHVPEAVNFELTDTPTRQRQFSRVPDIWRRLPSRLVTVLPDDATPELQARCRTIFGASLDVIQQQTKDRGESMALLHASVQVSSGTDVLLICDDGPGQKLIAREAHRLELEHQSGQAPQNGVLQLADSVDVLHWAIEAGAFKDRTEFLMRYKRMSELDEALPRDVKTTGLTKSPPWPAGA